MKSVLKNEKINVLGTIYTCSEVDEDVESRITNMLGYCDFSTKEIGISDSLSETSEGEQKDILCVKKRTLRHEIIHAFMFESGLDTSSDFARDETLIDWLAIQIPKIIRVMKSIDCL